jgi:hypothetical protein
MRRRDLYRVNYEEAGRSLYGHSYGKLRGVYMVSLMRRLRDVFMVTLMRRVREVLWSLYQAV